MWESASYNADNIGLYKGEGGTNYFLFMYFSKSIHSTLPLVGNVATWDRFEPRTKFKRVEFKKIEFCPGFKSPLG